MDSDLNCEHYTRAWVLDCVLSGLVYQIKDLGADEESVDALAPPPAEALATALSEVALDPAATLALIEEEEEAWVAARRLRRHREVLQASLTMEDSEDGDPDDDMPESLGVADAGRTAPTRTHAPSTGPSGATT